MPFELPYPLQFHGIISTIGPMDILDIFIVAVILYKVYVMLQDTRAITLVKGILVLLGVTMVCSWLELHVISWLLQKAVTLLFVALPIVFQPELRRALEHLGQGKFLGPSVLLDDEEAQSVVRELAKAVKVMSANKTGALIVIERNMGLNDISATGIQIDGLITADFLLNVFIPNTPLHDGAAIIENGRIKDILPRPTGESERMIEEFMLTANQAAATLAMEQELPFIYRVHEQPPVIKINLLHDLLTRLNLPAQRLLENPQPKDFSDILEGVRGTELEPAINGQLLRTMSKAIYSEKNIGHFGLVLDNYAHFTSPIRRYPDLAIHRILSSYLAGSPKEKLKKRYGSFVPAASKNASQMEQNAMNIERDCEDCYKAEYMSGFIGQSFTGRITGVTSFGFFVELENSVEGLVSINDLPVGDYQLEEGIELKDSLSGNFYRIGQSQQVTVASVDVSAGQVNFTLA